VPPASDVVRTAGVPIGVQFTSKTGVKCGTSRSFVAAGSASIVRLWWHSRRIRGDKPAAGPSAGPAQTHSRQGHALRIRHGPRRRCSPAPHVRFYLVAILFLVFDVELLFLYPWAVSAYSDNGVPAELRDTVFGVMLVFMATLALAWVYAWRKGVFRWR